MGFWDTLLRMEEIQDSIRERRTHLGFLGLGWISATGQVLLFREFMSAFMGNEICFGLIMGFWLAWIALGAFLGSRVQSAGRTGQAAVFHLLILGLALLLPAQIAAARLLPLFLDLRPGQFPAPRTMALGIGVVLLPSGLAVGTAFPMGLRCLPQQRRERTAGMVYGLEALGSAFSSLLFVYVLAGGFLGMEVWALSAAAMGLGLSLGGWRGRVRMGGAGASLAVALACFAGLGGSLDERVTKRLWEKRFPGVSLLESSESRYQRLSIGLIQEQYLLVGNGSVLFEFPDPFRAAETIHGLLPFHPRPKRLLLLGGDLPGLVLEALRYPGLEILGVQLDPDLLRLQKEYSSQETVDALESDRVRLIFMDARRHLASDDSKVDVIVSSLPKPDTASLNRFYTEEFFQLVRSRLAAGGLFAVSVPGGINYYEGAVAEQVALVARTLKSVFTTVVALPGEEVLFLASPSSKAPPLDPEDLWERFCSLEIETDAFSPAHFMMVLERERMAFLKEELQKRDQGPLNTDQRPLSYVTHLAVWGLISDSPLGGLLAKASTWSAWWPAGMVALPLTVWVVWVWARPSVVLAVRMPTVYLAGTTGLSSMGIYVGGLFLIQSAYGFVYKEVGFLLASFMAGLMIGSMALGKVAARRVSEKSLLLADSALAGVLGLFALVSWRLLGSAVDPGTGKTAVGAVLFLGACLTGLEFPVSVSRLASSGMETSRSAGLLDAADHGGAMIGAVSVGLLLLPAFGITATCLLLAGLKASSAAMLYWGQRRSGR